ncbi:competence type IV pilus minor pilin ComGF [Jeotgalibacillus proteolyticus]|uniref:Prepilin-type N-terminal cleavage/methylation domain-containing protein n=1 Tax=Jeotgalibacillus proteolyticus TaxID=2082395 RepID=A0A2S5GEB9_9BACL|nr:competence type IV pilus minor pilin ComGF [Jeotgalibacillus proteolyticus]PPA71397.1 hypothetical protein C4B60_04855 [Jeotgalibacillus proteolyticus]
MKFVPQPLHKPVCKMSNGFTLIEVMICLAALTIIAALMPLIFTSLFKMNENLEYSIHEEWDLFSIQFRNEVKLHQTLRVEPQRLTLTSPEGNLIVFSLYGSLLRRQVNGAGHEIYLTSLKTAHFTISDQIILLEVEFLNGKKRIGQFTASSGFSAGQYNASCYIGIFSASIYGAHADLCKPEPYSSL